MKSLSLAYGLISPGPGPFDGRRGEIIKKKLREAVVPFVYPRAIIN